MCLWLAEIKWWLKLLNGGKAISPQRTNTDETVSFNSSTITPKPLNKTSTDMTKYFLRLLLLIATIIGVLLLIERMLPRSYDFQQTVEIERPADEIFPYLNSLKKWPQWSHQFNTEKIEQLVIKYNGTEEGVGAAQTWTEIRGEGKLWITKSTPNKSLSYTNTFHNFPEMTSTFTLEPDGENKTIVIWHSAGQLPSTPLYGLMAPFFPGQLGYAYDKSLAELKALVEQ